MNGTTETGYVELPAPFDGPTVEINEYTIAKLSSTIKNLTLSGNKPRRFGIQKDGIIIFLFDDRTGYTTTP